MMMLPTALNGANIPVVVGEGAFCQIDQVVKQLGLVGRGVAVYDDQAMLTLKDKPKVFRSIPFDNEQLYLNGRSLFYLRMQFAGEGDYLIACGGETIQALTKMIAAEFHIPYIAVPTCAYGMSLANSSANMDDQKGFLQVKGAAPVAIVADTALMARSASSITLGAIHELIDYAASLSRSRALALAAGYAWNQPLMDCQMEAIDQALEGCNTQLRKGSPVAYEKLCRALIICGLAQGQAHGAYPHRLNFLHERALRSMPDAD